MDASNGATDGPLIARNTAYPQVMMTRRKVQRYVYVGLLIVVMVLCKKINEVVYPQFHQAFPHESSKITFTVLLGFIVSLAALKIGEMIYRPATQGIAG